MEKIKIWVCCSIETIYSILPSVFLSLFDFRSQFAPVDKGKIDLGAGVLFAFFLDPTCCGFEGGFADEIHHGARDGSLELDVGGVKDSCAIGLSRVALEMPMAGNIIKVAGLVIVESPGQAILGRSVCMVIKRCVLGMEKSKKVEIRYFYYYYCDIFQNNTSDKDASKEQKKKQWCLKELTPYPGITFTDI